MRLGQIALVAGVVFWALGGCTSESKNVLPTGGSGGAAGMEGGLGGTTGGSGGTAGSGGATGGAGGASGGAAGDAGPDAGSSCSDGVKNGNEIAVDCGGGCLCDTDQPCATTADCKQGACSAGKCQPPNCTDVLKNGVETDTDCGGGACPPCDALKACSTGTDCKSGVCTQSICQAPTCTDKVQNGDETGEDCGGLTCPKCANGLGCAGDQDCVSGNCQSNKCTPAECANSKKDGSETDVDCGGSVCAPCDPGLSCAGGSDCKSGICTGGKCAAAACPDGVKNGSETDVDCGGTGCPPCANTLGCATHADCQSGVCSSAKTCSAPTCTDLTKNGAETDVDCGGGSPCAPCANGKVCAIGSDCVSGGCATNTCGPWSKRFGAAGDDIAYEVAVDAQGNVIVVGSFNGTVNFGGANLVAASANSEVFVVKLDRSGAHLWSRAFPGGGLDTANAVALGANGDVFVTGSAGQIDFGGGVMSPNGTSRDLFVVRLKGTDGSHMWSKLLGGTGIDQGLGIAVDKNGDVIVGGASTSASFSLGGPTFTGNGLDDALVVKLNGATGAHLWSVSTGTVGNDSVEAVTTDSAANVALVGVFNGSTTDLSGGVNFGTTLLKSVGLRDIMMVKLAGNDGSEMWAKSAGSPNDDFGFAIAADPSDALWLTGQRASGLIDFGGGALANFGSFDVYAVKLAAGGAHVWSAAFGGSAIDAGHSVAMDGFNPVLTGSYASTNLDFGSGVLPGNGGKFAPYVAELAGASGAHLFSAGAATTGDAFGAVAVGPGGNVVRAGRFTGTLDVGAGGMTSAGANDVWIASMGATP